ncbi:MBL fold metallo-hydrolase [Natrinema sp. 74]|uniref:MBL fold metallo-hydrolase n=1 Tax=Natrinema sp. 74 TaxID=3384159 RepID=UPI0038D484EE
MTDRSDDADRASDNGGASDNGASIAPAALVDRLRAGDDLTVLDVRDRDEFERWHLEGEGIEAVQVPHVRFIQAEATGGVDDLVADLDDPILAVCGHGEASAHAVGLLRDTGVEAYNLAGGMDAWADLYLARELETDAPATLLQYDRPSSGCLAYLVVSGDEAAVIDPLRAFANRYVAAAADRGAELSYAVDTHVHADHVSGVRDLAARTDAEAVVPEGARDRGLAFDARTLVDTAERGSASPASHARPDGDELRVGEATLTAMATPGHTTESLSYRLGDVLFTGDTLFLEGVGRPDLEGGRDEAPAAARRLYESLQKQLLEQSDETTIAPGHYSDAADPRADGTYAVRLGDLRGRLPALSMRKDEFVDRATSDLPPRPANDERIVAVNLGREDVDEETAFELELGPNNCAVAD